jgi:hypothetical protein
MKVAVRKLPIEDVAKLQTLVAQNIDAIEPGLVVLDSRLLLGHATIDVVGLDANGALVLIATGLVANEEMLLKAVEVYSWCREYPQSLERLYPSCVISDDRPPRMVFVVERMPDAFHRKIKQMGFPEVDCVEFRLLDVDGAPAVYFDSILKLRRHIGPPAPEPTPRLDGTAPEHRGGAVENVIAMNGAAAARATSLKLQKLLNQAVADAPLAAARTSERPVATREPAPVVSMVTRETAAPALGPQESLIAPQPMIVAPEPVVVAPVPTVVVPEPVVVAPAPAIVEPAEPALALRVEPAVPVEPVVAETVTSGLESEAVTPNAEMMAELERALATFQQDQSEPGSRPSIVIPSLNGTAGSAVPPLAAEPVSLRTLPELSLQPSAPVAVPRPAPLAAPAGTPETPVSFKDLAAALLGAAAKTIDAAPVVEPAAPMEPVVAQAAEPTVTMPSATLQVEAPVVEPALTVESLSRAAATPAEPVAAPPAATKPAPELPEQFAGLKFPNDGVLTRQWMEFLSQMSTTK